MESKIFTLGFFLTLCGLLRILNAAPTLNESMLSHSVLLKFSNVNLNQWRTEGKDTVMQEVVANLTTVYCQANYQECGLSNSASSHFNSDDVKTVRNYPKNKDADLETLIYVEISNSSADKIPGAILQIIITNGNSRIKAVVGYSLDSIKSGQTLFDSDEAGVNNELNKIMIPVAFFLLFAIAFICWILHRGNKKKQAREERRRYAALHNSKNAAASLREKGGAMVNTADSVQPAQSECRPTPAFDPPENGAQDEANNNIRRHKKKRSPSKKQPIRKASADESDDVFDEDPDEKPAEKPKKKGRRRKGRRSYDLNQDYETQAAKELASSQVSSEGTNGDFRDNGGYQQDSEKGDSDPARNSNADSAVELNSSVASSANQSRARTLPPIPRASQQEIV